MKTVMIIALLSLVLLSACSTVPASVPSTSVPYASVPSDKHSTVLSDEQLGKEAEKTAQGFAIAWQNEDYYGVYDYLIPSAQDLRSKQEFSEYCTAAQKTSKFLFIYDKVVLQDKSVAYAYYTFTGDSATQMKTPAIEMIYINNTWKLNALNGFLTKTCVSNDCTLLTESLISQFVSDCTKSLGKTYGEFCEKYSVQYYENVTYRCNRQTGFICSPSRIAFNSLSQETISEIQTAGARYELAKLSADINKYIATH